MVKVFIHHDKEVIVDDFIRSLSSSLFTQGGVNEEKKGVDFSFDAEIPTFEDQLEVAKQCVEEISAIQESKSTSIEKKEIKRESFFQEPQEIDYKERKPSTEGDVVLTEEDVVLKDSENSEELLHKEKVIEVPLHRLDSEKTRAILEEINNLAQNVQVQKPDMTILSQKVLETLKETNSQLFELQSEKKHDLKGIKLFSNIEEGKEFKNLIQSKEVVSQKGSYEDPRMEVLKQRILEQVRFQMQLLVKGKSGESLLRLNPTILGSINIKMQMKGNKMSAHFHVENQSVKEILQKDLELLQDSLEEKGIELTDVEVSVSDEDDENSHLFQSKEDREIVKRWISSFITLGEESVELLDSNEEEVDPDQLINIVV